MNYFYAVTRLEPVLAVLTSRHYFAVYFDCQPAPPQIEQFDQAFGRGAFGHLAIFSVDGNFHYCNPGRCPCLTGQRCVAKLCMQPVEFRYPLIRNRSQVKGGTLAD